MRARGTAAVVASPVLVGAVTTLIVIVSVFLAYNANKGLPFVPTYDINAVIPNGANLVAGNEVRVGGFRVGVVNKITPSRVIVRGTPRNVAELQLKLDKTVEPLAVDTLMIVRARSALGLKYLELSPGSSDQKVRPGGRIELKNATAPTEFDDFLNTFDLPTRQNSRRALVGFGDAFAGRGQSINRAIAAFNPFFEFLTPVMRNLADPRTGLEDFFKEIGETAAQVVPVARVQAVLFEEMADTFEAFNACPTCLQETIEKGPPTMDAAIRSFPVQRRFLANFADLSRRLNPAARVLPVALPRLNSAFAVGTDVLPDTVRLNENTERLFEAINDLVEDPTTLLALNDLRDTLGVSRPLLTYTAPFQSVCNYGVYWFGGLSGIFTEGTNNGTALRVPLKSDNRQQENRYSTNRAERPADVPSNRDPKDENAYPGGPPVKFNGGPYAPAIDAQGNADCDIGQTGYIDGPTGDGRYGPAPASPDFDDNFSGGSSTLYEHGIPGLAGPTFTGVENLRDVP